MAGLRLALGMEVRAGDEHAGSRSLPGLVELLDGLPPERKPALVRGDCGFGPDTLMRPLEESGPGYLFKLKRTKNVKRHIERLFRQSDWTDAGQGWEGKERRLKLTGWEAARRAGRKGIHERILSRAKGQVPRFMHVRFSAVRFVCV